MALRMRGIVLLILIITLLFVNLDTFAPQKALEDDDAWTAPHRFGEHEREQVLSMHGEDRLDVETPNTTLQLSEDPREPDPLDPPDPRPQAHRANTTRTATQKSPEATPIISPLPTESLDDIRLLIGVMSPFWTSARRQIIRNAYNRFPRDLPVDVVFVQGNLTDENPVNYEKVLDMQHTTVKWENETHGDIMLLDCVENLEEGKTYEFLSKVGREFSDIYTHVMKADDDSFINIPGTPQHSLSKLWKIWLKIALVEVLRSQKNQSHFYWGTTWREPGRQHQEMWGSGYILSMDLVKWISTSSIPYENREGFEDLQVCNWLIEGGLDDNYVVNRSAFAGYPWPELGDWEYKQENDIRPFDRWTLVTHPLKEDFMWVETAEYYLGLIW